MAVTEQQPDPCNAARSDRPWLKYRVGDEADGGEPIVEILQRLNQCFVFINPQGNPQWEYHETCVDADASSAVAISLVAQVNGAVWPRTTRRRLFGVIADALANALNARLPNDTRDFFVHARSAVDAARAESLRVTYLLSATSAAVVIATVLSILAVTVVPASSEMFLISAALGSLGAMLSVWLRFRELPIEAFTSHWYTVIGGVSRVAFGAFFGTIFLLFHRAGIVLTILKDEYAIAGAAVVSGFSERLIPELLASFERNLTPRASRASETESPSQEGG